MLRKLLASVGHDKSEEKRESFRKRLLIPTLIVNIRQVAPRVHVRSLHTGHHRAAAFSADSGL